ncbi:MAG TPA: phosphoribosyltransferase family protein [Bacillota bacterium]|nr:phosphoribosyltransferase family protein [Bacillota bacterium]
MAKLRIIGGVSRVLFGEPAYCCLCGAPASAGVGICGHCLEVLAQEMAWVCKVCGIPLRPPLELCNGCRLNMYWFDVQRSLGIYHGKLMSAIRRMKYGGERWLSRPLGRMLSRLAEPFSYVDLVVPVPLVGSTRRARGYNQAKDLAQEVSANICVPLADILEREEARGPQARLNRSDRLRNLRGTMRAAHGFDLDGARVLLVDDVATTGATLDEAARVLKSAGAARVCCVTLARTLQYPLAEEEG